MQTLSGNDRENRRIIVFRRLSETNLEVLLATGKNKRTLPQVQITRSGRVAQQLTAAIRETCGMDAVCVHSLESPSSDAETTCTPYEIMEPYDPQGKALREQEWVAVHGLMISAFRDPKDFHAIQQAVASTTPAAAASGAPFASLGWFHALEHWVQRAIGVEGFHLNGRHHQLNACSTFSLIRFETDGPAVWFKAVGFPNQHEYAVTLALARSRSRFLPQIMATRPEFNGWLAREAEGSLLRECVALSSWESAASDLAQLQICSLGGNPELLKSGARDLRVAALANAVDSFFNVMGELMECQTKTPPAQLSRQGIRTLSLRVQDALSLLDKTAILETLGHLDLNPGNIVCSPHGSVFLDWAEAFVGHPFLTFGYLLEHFRRTFGRNTPQEVQFIAHYTFPWRASVSGDSILGALEVIPLLAAFAYAATKPYWKDPRTVSEPQAAYLWSLTRRMENEGCRIAERSVLCRN